MRASTFAELLRPIPDPLFSEQLPAQSQSFRNPPPTKRAMKSTLFRQTSLLSITGIIFLLSLIAPAQTLDLIELYRPFNPNASDQNYYGLVDLDQFPVQAYGYCKW